MGEIGEEGFLLGRPPDLCSFAGVMSRPPKKIWFAAKAYGMGWGRPLCWQGWIVYSVYIILLFWGIAEILVARKANPGFLVLYFIGVSLAVSVVCWFKGERLAWRWGGTDDE